MKRRMISLLLCLTLALGLIFPVHADEGDWQLKQVQVLYGGIHDSMPVLHNKEGQLLTKLDSMIYYSASMGGVEKDGVIIYCTEDQQLLFNRYTFINPQTGNFSVGLYLDDETMAAYVSRTTDYGTTEEKLELLRAKGETRKKLLDKYFSQSNTQVQRIGGKYLLLLQGTFTQTVSFGGEIWVPLAELLPLMDVHAFVSEDGRYLCMDPVQKSFYQVLRDQGERAQDLLFDSEDVVGNEIIGGGGWLISTFTGEIHRLVPVLGKMMDYEALYEQYLVDNEAYLSAFQIEESDTLHYITGVSKSAKSGKTLVSKGIKGIQGLYQLIIRDEPDRHHYMRFFEMSEDFRFGVGTTIDVAASLMDYFSVYYNQVEDHRRMLMAVYGYNADKTWPSYKAAKNVTALYDAAADKSGILTDTVLRDALFQQISDIVYGKLYGPWYDVIEVGKVVFSEEFEYINNSTYINMVSNNALYAYSVFQQRLFDAGHSAEELDETRLCLMMALLASRFAYNTYWDDMKQDEVDAIDEILTELYTVGRWETVENNKSYSQCRDTLRKALAGLAVQKNDPVTLAENYMVAQTLNSDYWYSTDRWDPPGWYLYDTDGDELDALYIHHWIPHAAFYITMQIDPQAGKAVETQNDYGHTYYTTPCLEKDGAQVFGDTDTLMQSLKSHFDAREGLLGSLETDLNGDGKPDRIYAVYRAAEKYNRTLENNLLQLYDGSISLVVALTTEDGVELQFFWDGQWDAYALEQTDPDQWKTRLALPMTFHDGILTVAGQQYAYRSGDSVFSPLR